MAVVRIATLVVTLAVIALFGVRASLPPAVVPAAAAASAFSAERAMADIRTIGVRPHAVASADDARVRAYLAGRLRSLGIAPEERRYLIDPKGYATLRGWNPALSPSAELVDLVGILPGRDRSLPAVALMAHMDTVWGSPGAADDSIGVATILETLRAIAARGTPARDIVVVLTDGEEIGLSGARAFWPSDAIASHVGVVINLESRGAGGRATMFETGTGNSAMIALFAKSVPHPIADSMAVLAYRLMPNNTDFTVALDRGLPGFNFAMLGRPEYYHSPRATVDRVDPRTVQDMGTQALGIASALAFGPALPAAGHDAVFFDVAGHGLVHYGIGTGWLIVVAAALALGAAVAGCVSRGALRPVELLGGVGATFWLIANGLLASTAFNLLSGSGRHPNYYDRLAALPMLELQAGLLAVAVSLGFLSLRRSRRRIAGLAPSLLLGLLAWVLGGPHGMILAATLVGMAAGWFATPGGASRWGGWLGGIAIVVLFAIGLQAKAPLAAWIFAWPALVFALAAVAAAWTDPALSRPSSYIVAGLAAAIVGVPLLPLVHLTFLGVGASLAPALTPFLLLAAVGLWPLARIDAEHRAARAGAAILLVVAAGIASHVRHAPIAPTVPAYSIER